MSKSVIEEIIHRVKQAKYYAFLLDCTRDVSRVEQMSTILRFCNSSTGAIEEHFVGFIAFAETTGEYITNSILQELDRNGLDIQNCRGQGYDKGANRVGINKGVRTSILNTNPRAFFTPWIQEFRNTGFDNSVAQARLFVEKGTFQIESQFKEKRTARKKRMFGYEHIDEPIQSFEMQYRVNFSNTMIDAIIVDTECRFKALNEYFEQFGFIYDNISVI
ncbi:zinc finger MYM-type protein 1 [Trichonephila clavipes]|nr:zinc finger MYM-type protein 1 [Trichonephila clavipes]